jgi:hypothetical protein
METLQRCLLDLGIDKVDVSTYSEIRHKHSRNQRVPAIAADVPRLEYLSCLGDHGAIAILETYHWQNGSDPYSQGHGYLLSACVVIVSQSYPDVNPRVYGSITNHLIDEFEATCFWLYTTIAAHFQHIQPRRFGAFLVHDQLARLFPNKDDQIAMIVAKPFGLDVYLQQGRLACVCSMFNLIVKHKNSLETLLIAYGMVCLQENTLNVNKKLIEKVVESLNK